MPTKFMRSAKTIFSDNKGASAVEFALVSPLFILALLFVLIVGLIVYLNLALDFATDKAARQIMTGSVQKSALTQTQFINTVVCPSLPAAINCSDVIVNVYSVTEAAGPQGYYNFANSSTTSLNMPALSNGSSTYNPGAQQSFEYIQVVYPMTFLPPLLSSLLGSGATYKGSPAFLIVSTAAFKNEQY